MLRAADELDSGKVSQTGKDVYLPALNFLWEVYKIILDIIRSNKAMLEIYNDTCRHAIDFCVKYQRKKDFTKLTDILSHHLNSIFENAEDFESKL